MHKAFTAFLVMLVIILLMEWKFEGMTAKEWADHANSTQNLYEETKTEYDALDHDLLQLGECVNNVNDTVSRIYRKCMETNTENYCLNVMYNGAKAINDLYKPCIQEYTNSL